MKQIAILLAVLMLVGCAPKGTSPNEGLGQPPAQSGNGAGGNQGQPETPEPTQNPPSLNAPPGFYSPDVRTGTPEIDKVIQAVITRDGTALAGFVSMSTEACTTQVHGMPGKPVCDEGTPDGTLVEVFPSGSCQPYFIHSKSDAEQSLRSRFMDQYYVFAVFKLDGEAGGAYSARSGVILGTGAAGVGVTLFLDAQGSIVQVAACGDPANMVPQGATFILTPKGAQMG